MLHKLIKFKLMSFALILVSAVICSSCGNLLLLMPESAEKDVSLYAPEMKDPQLEKRILDLVIKSDKTYDKDELKYSKIQYDDTIAKTYIVSADWMLLRNQFGIIEGRRIQVEVIGKTNIELKSGRGHNMAIQGDFKAGEYYLQIWNIDEDYVGGEFSDKLIVRSISGGHAGRHHINQEQAKMAIKGDFSFLK